MWAGCSTPPSGGPSSRPLSNSIPDDAMLARQSALESGGKGTSSLEWYRGVSSFELQRLKDPETRVRSG